MPIHITVDQGANWAANRWIAYKQPNITEERKVQILDATKYNSLVTAFNISTVLLVAAVAFAVLFAYTAAVALGSIAIFTRFTTEKEIEKYTRPNDPGAAPGGQQGGGAAIGGWDRLRGLMGMNMLRHALGQAEMGEKENNIFLRTGSERPENWTSNQVFVFDHAVWKNYIPVPAERAAAEVQAEDAAID